MIAIFLSNGVFVGSKQNVTIKEAESFEIDYVLVESMPEALINIPPNHYAIVDAELNVTYEPAPVTPTSPEERVAQLESESAMLALELVDTQIRLEQAETKQAALLLELIDKGVL